MVNEAADCDVSAADGVKEGGVGREAKGAGYIGGESSVFKIGDGRDGGVDGKSRDKLGRGVYVGRVGTSVRGIGGVERGEGVVCGVARHTFSLARLEPTRTGGGGKETRTEGLKEGGDGEERVR